MIVICPCDISCERMDEIYFLVSSSDSSTFYGGKNTPCNFKVKLYKPLTLQGRWEVGLASCLLDTKDPLPLLQLVHLPFCDSLVVIGGESRLPVVKQLVRSEEGVGVWSFDPPSYVPVGQSFLETLEIYITTADGRTPSFKNGRSTCVLHFRRCE